MYFPLQVLHFCLLWLLARCLLFNSNTDFSGALRVICYEILFRALPTLCPRLATLMMTFLLFRFTGFDSRHLRNGLLPLLILLGLKIGSTVISSGSFIALKHIDVLLLMFSVKLLVLEWGWGQRVKAREWDRRRHNSWLIKCFMINWVRSHLHLIGKVRGLTICLPSFQSFFFVLNHIEGVRWPPNDPLLRFVTARNLLSILGWNFWLRAVKLIVLLLIVLISTSSWLIS